MASSDVAIPVPPTVASSAPPGSTPPNIATHGLTSKDAQSKLQQIGPNSMPDTAAHPLGRAIEKLWAPVPWMLEAAIVLQLFFCLMR
jgi:H+-transporting ATPase